MADYYWSTKREGETSNIEHVRLIGAGGFGEVHEVSIPIKVAMNSQMRDKETKQVRRKTQVVLTARYLHENSYVLSVVESPMKIF
jgi:hypothetical protein